MMKTTSASRYSKPPRRQEETLREIPIPKTFQRELVTALLESAFLKGPEEILTALRKSVEFTDTGKVLKGEEGSEQLRTMISRFKDSTGRTALHYACLGRKAANAEYILKMCPMIAAQEDSAGETPLMTAARAGDVIMTNILLHYDPNVNARSQAGISALHLAAESGNALCVRTLVDAGAEVNCYSEITGTPLLYAVSHNHYEAAEELLKRKADPNFPFDVRGVPHPAFPPPLLFACDTNEDAIVELLLKYKANPNLRDKNGWTALHCAAEAGSYRIVDLLLQAGANPDVITQGLTAFDVAMENSKWAVADLLKQRTAIFLGENHATWLRGIKEARLVRSRMENKEREEQPDKQKVDEALILKAEGDAYNKAGDYSLALERYTAALMIMPDTAATKEQRAILYAARSLMNLSVGDLVSAEYDANRATELQPLWSKGFVCKAQVYKKKNEWKEYTKHLYEALTRADVQDDELIAALKHAVEMTVRDEETSKR